MCPTTIIIMHIPRIKAIFTILEPSTFPIETPTFSGFESAKMETLSSGREVEKPTRIKPTVVFPKPVISETFTEFLIVISLPTTKSRIETSKMSALATAPNCSNISVSPSLLCLRNAPYNIYEHSSSNGTK